MIIQFCGLSGSGKTTLADLTNKYFRDSNLKIEVIDADEYRKFWNNDLGYSKEDRNNNIRRLGFLAGKFSKHGIVPIICAINPYESIRKEFSSLYKDVKTIFIKCNLEELKKRDPKGLYAKALLPDSHPDKIFHFTGVSDPFEIPVSPDLVIETDRETEEESALKLIRFIESNYNLYEDK
jgi:adenylylsulfate kinase